MLPNDNHPVAQKPTVTALQIRQVSKTFVNETRVVQALAPVDLDVRAGEFVCLLGASGCGKSTLLSLIAGLDRPTEGKIISNGREVTGPGVDRVLLFQSRAKRAEIASYWIDRVHLKGFEHAFTHQLSGGMRQRVALARSLAIDPAILLMDEPFGALDALTRDRLHIELESIWAATNKTILFVTHNVREAVAIGDRVLVFSPRPGRIIGEFKCDLPRPRSLEDPAVVSLTAPMMALLRQTIPDNTSA
jgi:NitT/TauT family transport system ATP-binding protein